MEIKNNQKGFLQIPFLITIIIASISVASVGTGVILYKQQKTPYFTHNVSEIIYKTVYEQKFIMEELKQEAKLSEIKRERAEKNEQEEIIKRVDAEEAKEEAEKITQQETTKRIQEETARKIAENEKEQEEIARKVAEEKAQQEEYTRKAKEKELAEKEAEEKKMNADNDGDGLTYREEEKKGTSDWNTDSDGDGINDKEDLNPTGGGEYKPQYFEWEYKDTVWEWTYSIHEDWYNYYYNKPRSSHGLEYITTDDPFIKEIAKALKKSAEKENYHLSSFIISFVQGLPYVADFHTDTDDRPKYPVETFIDRNGDCEDFAYLSASLIQATGLGASLIEFHNHMGIGIKTTHSQSGYYYPIGDDWYYYYETTGEGWDKGQLPSEYIYEKAKITRIWDGSIYYLYPKYVKPCDYSSSFSGYYTDGDNYYSDNQCNNLVSCLKHEGYYYNYKTENFYWDSSCNQILTKGCYKSTDYPGYFEDSYDFYYNSQCTQIARICRPFSIYSDKYWDGENSYWDSSCTLQVVSWCSKSTYHPGYFFSSLDYEYYSDYQCTIIADLY